VLVVSTYESAALTKQLSKSSSDTLEIEDGRPDSKNSLQIPAIADICYEETGPLFFVSMAFFDLSRKASFGRAVDAPSGQGRDLTG
jgi:hypothetical protein